MTLFLWLGLGTVVFLLVVALFLPFLGSSDPAVQNRQCPVCGSRLELDERLYADQKEMQSGPHQLTIKGCTHCYPEGGKGN